MSNIFYNKYEKYKPTYCSFYSSILWCLCL